MNPLAQKTCVRLAIFLYLSSINPLAKIPGLNSQKTIQMQDQRMYFRKIIYAAKRHCKPKLMGHCMVLCFGFF